MKAVILAGGRGTRLAPYTTVLPKPLMPLCDRPILEIIICQLRKSGFTDITMAVGYLAHLLHAYFEDGTRFGVNITYSYEESSLGTAGPLTLISGLNEPFLVMNGDVLTNLDYGALYAYHLERGADATISLYPRTMEVSLGVLEIDDAGEVVSYREKPSYSYLASMGIYVLSPRVLSLMERGQRCDFPDLVKRLLDRGYKVVGREFHGDWLDIGQPQEYALAAERFHDMIDAETIGPGAYRPGRDGHEPVAVPGGSQSSPNGPTKLWKP